MGFENIHETVVKDVFDVLKDGVKSLKNTAKPRSTDVRMSSSLARATSGLTLAFPVACTDTLSIENATMISKAIERKNVTLLQMAFSAYNITNATDAITHLAKFHSNLEKKVDLDSFVDAMESLGEGVLPPIPEATLRAIREDCRRNLNFAATPSINEESLLDYTEATVYGQTTIIKEAPQNPVILTPPKPPSQMDKDEYRLWRDTVKDNQWYQNFMAQQGKSKTAEDEFWYKYWQNVEKMGIDRDRFEHQKRYDEIRGGREDEKFTYQKSRDAKEDEYRAERDKRLDDLNDTREKRDAEKWEYQKQRDKKLDKYNKKRDKIRDKFDAERVENDKKKLAQDRDIARGRAADMRRQYLSQQLVPSDVKKANELQPSMMIVNFYVNDDDRDLNIAQQAVIGVKSKLYAINSADIINRIITKHIDNDIMLKLVKVSTREISFVKDFLLGLDEARLNSLNRSRNNSGNSLFNALERRAIKGKIRKSLRLENSAKAITTLVISAEEAEQLKKYNNIDVTSARVMIPIMEKLNLLYFVIVDTTAESIKMLTDGDTMFEDYSFTSLERDNGDSSYKKIVNLMTKIA